MLTVPNELALTESRTMRAASMSRVDVLDKVKTLAMLPGSAYASAEIVAAWFEVDTETLKKLIQRNREELTENELRVLRGDELRRFVGDSLSLTNELDPKIRNLTIFSRRTMLNVAMLLTGSKVAKDVRSYLLNAEAALTPSARLQVIDEAEHQMRVLKAAQGIVDQAWLELKARHVAARALGEEPEVDPLDRPLYVPDFLKAKGLKKSQIVSVQSWFGRRVAALFEAETGEQRPGSRSADTANGSVRDTVAWTERHRQFFEDTWARYYAKDYPPAPVQTELDGGAR